MKTIENLQKEVQIALKRQPSLHNNEIDVIVNNGVVTLTGTVNNYLKKTEAENTAKNVTGVKDVIEKIEVKYSSLWNRKSDQEIATDAINALQWNWSEPSDIIKVKVENGWVTLDGQLALNNQRESAKNAIKNLDAVKGMTNNIKIKSDKNDKIEKMVIESALLKNWSINDNDIKVKVKANEVTLSGIVDSYYQKDVAERIAWNAPGVWSVNNELAVGYFI